MNMTSYKKAVLCDKQVAISFAKILLQVTRPRTAVLGKIPRTGVYRSIQQYPEAAKVPGVLIVRVDSAIYFSNSNYVRERYRQILSVNNNHEAVQQLIFFMQRSIFFFFHRILRLLTDEEELKENNQQRIHYLIVEMSRKLLSLNMSKEY